MCEMIANSIDGYMKIALKYYKSGYYQESKVNKSKIGSIFNSFLFNSFAERSLI